MANNRELSQFGSLVEVSNEATSIKVGLADANVGLGTTNPTERLEVHGNIKVVGGSINVGSAGTFTQETQFNAGVGIADSIFHIGDTNTQVRFPAEDIVSVETGGSERLRVESGGGIGIGDSIYHLGDTNTQVRFPAADTFTVETAGSERFRVGSNGYVSVGKGAQGDELLHVGSASSLSPAIKVENDQGSLLIGRRQTSRFGIGTEGHVIQSVGDDFAIGTSDGEDFTIGTNNEKRITVKSGGRVGIGTDDPDELLEVLGKAKVIDLDASNISVASGVGTFQTLKVTGDLTVDGTTTTLDTTLIDVDRIEVGANSNSIVAVAVTQSGTADILKLFNGAGTEVLGITTDGNITIQNTDAGSSAAPELSLYRNSASPANADYLGQIKFQGENDAGAKVNYAKITGKILDVNGTGDSEDGILEFAFQKGGSNNISARFRSDSLQLINGTTLTVAGNITANGNIQGDGSTNISSINDITASGDLTIDGVSDLDELTVAGVSTFSSNLDVNASVDVSTDLTVDGITDLDELKVAGVSTFSDTVEIPSDSKKILLGAGKEMQVFHDGTDSLIKDTRNSGSVKIQADNFSVIDKDASETMLSAAVDGAVELNHDGRTRFKTTGLGVTVYGNLGVRTDLTVSGTLLLVGATSSTNLTRLGQAFAVVTTDEFGGGSFTGFNGTTANEGPIIDLQRSRATSKSPGTVVVNNDRLGSLVFRGDDGTDFADAAYMLGEVDGTPNGGFVPGRLTFYTGTASATPVERLRINSAGKLTVTPADTTSSYATTDGGIDIAQVISSTGTSASQSTGIQFSLTKSGQTGAIAEIGAIREGNGLSGLVFRTRDNSTGRNERLRIKSNGDVGIGTDSPNFTSFGSNTGGLEISDVNNNNALLVQSGGNEFYFANSSTTNYIWGDDDAAIVFGTNDTEKLRIKSDGLVGIGTNSPTHTLQLFGTSSSTLRISKKGVLAYDHTFDGSSYTIANNNGSAGIPIVIGTRTSGAESLRITAAGDVGIGTAVPITSSGYGNLSLAKTNGGQVEFKKLSSGRTHYIWGDDNLNIGAAYNGGGSGDFIVNVNGNNEKLRIKSNGQVGIGTNNPTGNCEVNGNDGLNISNTTRAGDNGVQWRLIPHNGGAGESPTNLRLYEGVGAKEVLNVTKSGQILVNKRTNRNQYYGGTYTGLLQVEGTDDSSRLTQFIHNAAAASQPILVLGKSRGTSTGSYTVVQSRDYLGTLSFQGADGDAMIEGARIDAVIAADPGNNDMPTDLRFGVTANGASSTTEALRIKHNGLIGVGTTDPKVRLAVSSTDAIQVPVGTTAQRPTGVAGYIRYNSDIGSYEGHNGSEWAGIGGAAEVETSVSSTAATTCESFAKATYRSATIVAQITQGSSYQVGNYLLIHDGTTATLVEESAVATGDMLGSFTATISGSNVVFQVNMASATAATVTTKMTKVSIP